MEKFEICNATIKLINKLVVALLDYACERRRIYYASIDQSPYYKAPRLEDPLETVTPKPTYPPVELSAEQENM